MRERHSYVARVVLVLFLAAAVLAVRTSGASAVIVRLANGKTLSYQPLRGGAAPFDSIFSNLDYNGGPVMSSNTNYPVYWDPSGGAAYPADYQPGLNRYFEDLARDSGGHENVDSVSTQYNDAAGEFANYDSRFGGALLDTDPYPASGCKQATVCLTDAQIRTELAKYVPAHGLARDRAHEYFLLTPPGVEDCFEAAGGRCSAGSKKPTFCAYHGDVRLRSGEIVYANDPYVTGIEGCDDANHPNGATSDGALEGGLSHEHNESITDPQPNNAWTDFGGSGGEIGDKCEWAMGAPLGTAPNGARYNQLIGGHSYWYQEEWSNQGNGCVQRFTLQGAEPTATFTSTPGAGNEVSFDASGSTAPGGVAAYNWQFNDSPGPRPGPSTPTELPTPTVSHTFPAAGRYLVALTVFAKDGTSIGTGRTVPVGTQPVPVVTRVLPASGPAAGGTRVTITGSGFSEATQVSFGSTPAAGFTVTSPTSITATSPPATTGTVDVTVASAAGTSATSLRDHFRYGPPTVTRLNPGAGASAGGTSVTVSGTGFAQGVGATAFRFGTAPATSVNCLAVTTCTMLAPAHAPGVVEVRATVGKATSARNPPADQFTYR